MHTGIEEGGGGGGGTKSGTCTQFILEKLLTHSSCSMLKEPEHFANYFCAQLGNLTKILVMLIKHNKITIPYVYPPSQHMVYKPHLTYFLHLY